MMSMIMHKFIEVLGGVRATLWFAGMLLFAALYWATSVKHTRFEAEVVAAEQQRIEEIAAKERVYQRAIYDVVLKNTLEKQKHEIYVNSLRADLASGKRVLKPRFTCPSAPAARGNGGEERGLRKEDGDFLIGEAHRADEVTRQLGLCQATIKEYQELNK